MGSENYIRNSAKKAQRELKEYTLFDNISVVIKDKVSDDIDLDIVFDTINKINKENNDLNIIVTDGYFSPCDKLPNNRDFVSGIKKHKIIEKSVWINNKTTTGIKNLQLNKNDNS